MTKNRYRILSIVILLLITFTVGNAYASEHRLESLDIDVFINGDGSARIKENRVANLVEGTENYIVIDNVGNSKIIDFVVYEDGNQYQYIDNWDIQASRDAKKYKNGIIKTSSGYELSWGIGEYGKHEYNLEYTVTNFVEQLNDSQIIFWRFSNPGTNIPPEKVKVTISSENEFTDENEKIWAFGFEGDIQFLDGKIVANSNRALSINDNVTILAKLPDGMFGTNKIRNQSFQEVQDQAFIGSDYDTGNQGNDIYPDYGYQDHGYNRRNPFSSIFRFFAMGNIFVFVVIFFGIISGSKSKLSSKTPVKFKKQYKDEYYRDFPYDGEFLDIYYIPFLMGTSNFEKLLTGFILKWINENRIITVEEEVGWLFKKDSTNLKFINTSQLKQPIENQLFQMMLTAAGSNEILEEKEFTKWAMSNYSKIDRWEKELKDYSINRLEELGYLVITEKKVLFFKMQDYELTEKGKELEANIYKYINYLNDYSLLNEHEAINVKLWDNIMIWAGFLGLTEVVSKQFEKLYPNYTQETVYRGNTIFLTSHLASNISQAKAQAQASRSSGSGGGSSMGGGGGFSGGGSGGGTR